MLTMLSRRPRVKVKVRGYYVAFSSQVLASNSSYCCKSRALKPSANAGYSGSYFDVLGIMPRNGDTEG